MTTVAKVVPATKTATNAQALNARCPVCHAVRDQPCVSSAGTQRRKPHQDRFDMAFALARNLEQRQAEIGRTVRSRFDGVTIRFECPVCGGGHSRADHDRIAVAPPGVDVDTARSLGV